MICFRKILTQHHSVVGIEIAIDATYASIYCPSTKKLLRVSRMAAPNETKGEERLYAFSSIALPFDDKGPVYYPEEYRDEMLRDHKPEDDNDDGDDDNDEDEIDLEEDPEDDSKYRFEVSLHYVVQALAGETSSDPEFLLANPHLRNLVKLQGEPGVKERMNHALKQLLVAIYDRVDHHCRLDRYKPEKVAFAVPAHWGAATHDVLRKAVRSTFGYTKEETEPRILFYNTADALAEFILHRPVQDCRGIHVYPEYLWQGRDSNERDLGLYHPDMILFVDVQNSNMVSHISCPGYSTPGPQT